MNRKGACAACHARDHGVKSRIAIPHTCGESWDIRTYPVENSKLFVDVDVVVKPVIGKRKKVNC